MSIRVQEDALDKNIRASYCFTARSVDLTLLCWLDALSAHVLAWCPYMARRCWRVEPSRVVCSLGLVSRSNLILGICVHVGVLRWVVVKIEGGSSPCCSVWWPRKSRLWWPWKGRMLVYSAAPKKKVRSSRTVSDPLIARNLSSYWNAVLCLCRAIHLHDECVYCLSSRKRTSSAKYGPAADRDRSAVDVFCWCIYNMLSSLYGKNVFFPSVCRLFGSQSVSRDF